MFRLLFTFACFFALVAPAWAGEQAPITALPSLDGDTLALLGGAGLLSDAVRRLERWTPTLRVELVQAPPPPSPPGTAEVPAGEPGEKKPPKSWVPRVVSSSACVVLLGLLWPGCLSAKPDTGDTGSLSTHVVVGCNNSSTWSAFWNTTQEDLSQLVVTMQVGGSEISAMSSDTCGEFVTGFACEQGPAAAKVEVYHLGLQACAQSSSDGAVAWSDCVWTATYIPCS